LRRLRTIVLSRQPQCGPVADLGEQRAVVSDEDHGGGCRQDRPGDFLAQRDGEVVGGLVEQQYGRA
jgi:hypothetical protein